MPQRPYNSASRAITLGTQSLAKDHAAPFSISEADLDEHFYIIGRSGTGKSNLLKELAIADMDRGAGLCFIDPLGSTAEELLTHIPHGKSGAVNRDDAVKREGRKGASGRDKDVIYIDAADIDHPIGINPLYNVAPEDRSRAVSDILQMFEGIWGETGWGARMEAIFRAALHTLIENPNCMRPSLLTVFRLLLDERLRNDTKRFIENPQLLDWWEYRFDGGDLNSRTRREWVEPVLNKIDALSLDPIIRLIIGQPRCTLDFDEIIKRRQILIVNLNQSKIGYDNASFIGMLILSRIRQAAIKHGNRDKPFTLTIDEAHSFPTAELTKIIAQGRHSGLFVRAAHQYLEQFDPKIGASLRNGCGTLAIFATGQRDAETLIDDLEPRFRDRMLDTLRLLERGQAIFRLTKDGAPQPATERPIQITRREKGSADPNAAIRFTRERFATDRLTAEFQIASAQTQMNREDHLEWKRKFRNQRKERAKAQLQSIAPYCPHHYETCQA